LTLTEAEQRALLRAWESAAHPRDQLLFSLALETDLGLEEIVGRDIAEGLPPGRGTRNQRRLAETTSAPRGNPRPRPQ